MADIDVNAFNRDLIRELREIDGTTSGPFAGAPLLLMTTTGAERGTERVIPIVVLERT